MPIIRPRLVTKDTKLKVTKIHKRDTSTSEGVRQNFKYAKLVKWFQSVQLLVSNSKVTGMSEQVLFEIRFSLEVLLAKLAGRFFDVRRVGDAD